MITDDLFSMLDDSTIRILDLDGNGVDETAMIDTDYDGIVDAKFGVNIDDDGNVDSIGIDTDFDDIADNLLSGLPQSW